MHHMMTSNPRAASSSDRVARTMAWLTWVAFALTALAMIATFADVPGAAPVDTDAWFGLGLDRLTVVLLLLVVGVSATVQSYACRYLRGEPVQARFVGLTVVLTVACAVLVSADTLVTLAVAWVATGLTIVALADLRPSRARVASDRRRIRIAFTVGDGALVIATIVLSALVGPVPLGSSEELVRAIPDGGAWAILAAVLVVVAACARCALVPFSSWLPSTLGAPTPVSALLHAGVVNGGGILLIRLAPVVDPWAPSWFIAAGIGTVTALWAAAVMSVTVDVKGSLVRSTSAQMGFMVVTIAAGLPAAAAAHLIAHGLYKAALFLGSGAVVHELTAARGLPPPRGHRSWPMDALAGAAPAAAIAGTVVVLGGTGFALELDGAKVALLCFAWGTASIALRGWMRRATTTSVLGIAVGIVVVCSSLYVVGVAAFTAALAPILPTAANGPGAFAFAPLAVGLLVLILGPRWIPATARLHRWAYVAVLSQTHAVRSWSPARPPELMPLDGTATDSSPQRPSAALVGSETT